jgi:hypothetical protein
MTGIHPEIHKQVYNFLEQELGIKKKSLKLPLGRDNGLPCPNDGIFTRNDEQQIQQRSEKYGI